MFQSIKKSSFEYTSLKAIDLFIIQLSLSIFCYFPKESNILLPRNYFEVFHFHQVRH